MLSSRLHASEFSRLSAIHSLRANPLHAAKSSGHRPLTLRDRCAGFRACASWAATTPRGCRASHVFAGLVLTTMLVPVEHRLCEASGVPGIYGLYATIVPLLAYVALWSEPRPGARP